MFDLFIEVKKHYSPTMFIRWKNVNYLHQSVRSVLDLSPYLGVILPAVFVATLENMVLRCVGFAPAWSTCDFEGGLGNLLFNSTQPCVVRPWGLEVPLQEPRDSLLRGNPGCLPAG